MRYLLSALHFQKFEDDESNDPLLLEYYDFLGFHGNYAKELAREQKNNYIYVSNPAPSFTPAARITGLPYGSRSNRGEWTFLPRFAGRV